MKSVLAAASADQQIAMPWTRGARRRPAAMKPAAASVALAAKPLRQVAR